MAEPVPDDEAVRILQRAIRGSGGRGLTREADLYLSSMVAECLADRLALAGFGIVRLDNGQAVLL